MRDALSIEGLFLEAGERALLHLLHALFLHFYLSLLDELRLLVFLVLELFLVNRLCVQRHIYDLRVFLRGLQRRGAFPRLVGFLVIRLVEEAVGVDGASVKLPAQEVFLQLSLDLVRIVLDLIRLEFRLIIRFSRRPCLLLSVFLQQEIFA